MQRFRTTADVFAVVKPGKKGTYKCPVDGCPRKSHLFVDAKDFGRHLAIFHKIPSLKARGRSASVVRSRKDLKLPQLHTKYCPNCGFNIEEAEQAAILLRRVR